MKPESSRVPDTKSNRSYGNATVHRDGTVIGYAEVFPR